MDVETGSTPESTTPTPQPDRERLVSGLKFLAGAVVVVGALVWLATSSLESQVYFFTVSEAHARGGEIGDRSFRLKGNVVRGSHFIREGTLDEHRFTLVDGGRTMEVSFRGPLPDTFTDEAEVVALGRVGAEGRFEAIEVVAKCPSRYEESAPTAKGGGLSS